MDVSLGFYTVLPSDYRTERLHGSRYIPKIEAIVKVKVKIKVTVEQTTKAQRGITVDV
jgi:hypothetical protein